MIHWAVASDDDADVTAKPLALISSWWDTGVSLFRQDCI